METLYLLIPISVLIIVGVSALFLRMASQGQFDDLDSPATRILLDDDRASSHDRKRDCEDQPVAQAPRMEPLVNRRD